MALFAVCSQLALVDVSVAILAVLSNAGKYRPDVTLGAGDRLMHAPQRIFGLIVVEFRNGADRPPRIGGVAVLARYAQVSVWTVRASCALGVSHSPSAAKHQKRQCDCLTSAQRPHTVIPCGMTRNQEAGRESSAVSQFSFHSECGGGARSNI